MEREDYVEVAVVDNEPEAELLRMLLEGAGIEVVIDPQLAYIMYPTVFPNYRLLVESKDLEKAREVVEAGLEAGSDLGDGPENS